MGSLAGMKVTKNTNGKGLAVVLWSSHSSLNVPFIRKLYIFFTLKVECSGQEMFNQTATFHMNKSLEHLRWLNLSVFLGHADEKSSLFPHVYCENKAKFPW